MENMMKSADKYFFDGFFVKIPIIMNSYNTLFAETKKQVKQMLHEGLTLDQMREANINKTHRIKLKLQIINLALNGEKMNGEQFKADMEDKIEFAHGVIICAYIKACKWGDDFGIMLHDGTMPLLPIDQREELCRKIAKLAETQMNKN
tara:strand:- start:1534 stop:1977 length:444 start_codon:yes stop_codon:yes gene_type:complete